MDDKVLESNLEDLKQRNRYRSRWVLESPQGVKIICDGKKLLNFCSNDYLGLANHPAVIEAFQRGAEKWGVGSGSAHLICGHSEAHHRLEAELAEFTGRPRALLFSTGYMANLGAVSALVRRGDSVFEDRLNHASLLDGGILSQASFRRYQHGNIESLERMLSRLGGGRCMIVSDGVFSMDGDLAPVPDLVTLSQRSGACLLIDDAHGLGVIGKRGRGCLEHFQLAADEVQLLVGTLGKAFGTFGAFVAGSEALIETLIQTCRTYLYTTAISPAIAEATRASLKLVDRENWRREKLAALIAQFRIGAHQLGLELRPSKTPIQPIVIGDNQRALNLSKRLKALGFLCGAIRPPSVADGSARLRVTLSALHEEDQVERFLDALARTHKKN